MFISNYYILSFPAVSYFSSFYPFLVLPNSSSCFLPLSFTFISIIIIYLNLLLIVSCSFLFHLIFIPPFYSLLQVCFFFFLQTTVICIGTLLSHFCSFLFSVFFFSYLPKPLPRPPRPALISSLPLGYAFTVATKKTRPDASEPNCFFLLPFLLPF